MPLAHACGCSDWSRPIRSLKFSTGEYQRTVCARKNQSRSFMPSATHPWIKSTRDAASVRIAMTVGRAGDSEGRLEELVSEDGLDTDAPVLVFNERMGVINPDLSVGVDVTASAPLRANSGICQQGVKLVGSGFVLSSSEKEHFVTIGAAIIKPYLSGREFVQHTKQRFVIDFFGLDQAAARHANPAAYQRILQTVKPLRDHNREISRRTNWWLFGRSNIDLRTSLIGLERFIATPEVAKHRPFAFVNSDVIVDASIYCIALSDAYHLGVLSSAIHVCWAIRAGGWLGVGNDPRYFNTGASLHSRSRRQVPCKSNTSAP